MPDTIGTYIVLLVQKYNYETEWEKHIDAAFFEKRKGAYIDGMWDTFNDWEEGQETHISHWMPLPDPPKE